jgi:hypothetical protein
VLIKDSVSTTKRRELLFDELEKIMGERWPASRCHLGIYLERPNYITKISARSESTTFKIQTRNDKVL